MSLRCFSSLLSLFSKHVFIEEAVLHGNGVDDAVDDHRLLPLPCSVKVLYLRTVLLSQVGQGCLIKGKNLFSQFLKSFFHKDSESSSTPTLSLFLFPQMAV